MGFQEEMQSNFRTKEELQLEKDRVFQKEIRNAAQADFIDIQNGLLHAAKLGQYRNISGVNAVIYSNSLYSLRNIYHRAGRHDNWLSIDVDDKSIRAEFHPITHKLIRQHEFHNIVKYSVVEDNGLRLYLNTLKKLCESEHIHVELCLCKSNDFSLLSSYSLPCTLYDEYNYKSNRWSIHLKATYLIPSETQNSHLHEMNPAYSYDLTQNIIQKERQTQLEKEKYFESKQQMQIDKKTNSPFLGNLLLGNLIGWGGLILAASAEDKLIAVFLVIASLCSIFLVVKPPQS